MSRPGHRAAAVLGGVVVLVVLAGVVAALLGSGGGRAEPAPTTSTSRARATSAAPRTPTARSSRPSSASSRASSAGRDPASGLRLVALADLPRQAQDTVALIERGGPFPYDQDGVTFGNYERVLPVHARGYYREYTVRTPGENDRGPRRIVTGNDDRELFYTADHYATFVRVSR